MNRPSPLGALVCALCLYVATAAVAPHPVSARQSAPEQSIRVFVSPGLRGAIGSAQASGVGGLAQLTVERGAHRGLLRVSFMWDVAGFPDSSEEGGTTEVGLLYGRTSQGAGGPGRSISAGLAVLHFQDCPGGSEDSFYEAGCSTVGIPLLAEAGVGTRVVGVAVQLFGNLNVKAPFAGVGLTLPLGWMP